MHMHVTTKGFKWKSIFYEYKLINLDSNHQNTTLVSRSSVFKSYFCVLDSRFFRNMDNLLLKSIADSVQELTEDEQVRIFIACYYLRDYFPQSIDDISRYRLYDIAFR